MSAYRLTARWWADGDEKHPGLTINTPQGTVHIPAHKLRQLADAAHDAADDYESQEQNTQ